jgi:hypothetical protein
MCPSYGTHISIIATGKPFEPLMNDHFMNQEIGKAIQSKPGPDRYHPVHLIHNAQHDKQPTGYCKNKKESIVLFKETGALFVMVPVQVPPKAMHYIAMQTPGKPFHENESDQYNYYIKQPVHLIHKSFQYQKEHKLYQQQIYSEFVLLFKFTKMKNSKQ